MMSAITLLTSLTLCNTVRKHFTLDSLKNELTLCIMNSKPNLNIDEKCCGWSGPIDYYNNDVFDVQPGEIYTRKFLMAKFSAKWHLTQCFLSARVMLSTDYKLQLT